MAAVCVCARNANRQEQCVAGIIGPTIHCSSYRAAKVTDLGGPDVSGPPFGHRKLAWGSRQWVPLVQAWV